MSITAISQISQNSDAGFGSEEYGGKIWIPIPDAAFMRWRVSPESGGRTLVAYQGTKLVGTVFSFPQSLRIGDTVFPVAICTGFSVDPEYRGAALPLIQRLRQRYRRARLCIWRRHGSRRPDVGVVSLLDQIRDDLSAKIQVCFQDRILGQVSGNAGACARRNWRLGADCEPRLRSGASFHAVSNMIRMSGPIARTICSVARKCSPGPPRVSIGRWTGSRRNWRLNWKASAFHTLVFESDGEIKGMVNCHAASMHGRETVNAAMIDLWAEDGLSGGRAGAFVESSVHISH